MKHQRAARLGATVGQQGLPQASHPNRLLVVDDELDISQWIAQVLAGSGYQVDTAEDGASGWEALQARNYDLLITDNNMPKVSGVELVKKLRSEDLALPVILVSGAMPIQELNLHPWLQVTATLSKPFTGGELVAIVQKILHPVSSTRDQGGAETVRRGGVPVHSVPV
jgi:DNA-binding response OmpR family regulator